MQLCPHNYWGEPGTQSRVMSKSRNESQKIEAEEFESKARAARNLRRGHKDEATPETESPKTE